MSQEVRKNHLINQPAQFGVLCGDVRDDCLGEIMRRVQDTKGVDTNIDLAPLHKHEYPVFPPLEILSTNFRAQMCGLCGFPYKPF